ncbi:hypothetical protein [Streptomyces sp. NPDC055607]
MHSGNVLGIGSKKWGAAAIAATAALVTVAPAANASPHVSAVTAIPHPGAPVIVSMGDSFMAGTAGRWEGNSLDPFGNRNYIDRAYVNGQYEV